MHGSACAAATPRLRHAISFAPSTSARSARVCNNTPFRSGARQRARARIAWSRWPWCRSRAAIVSCPEVFLRYAGRTRCGTLGGSRSRTRAAVGARSLLAPAALRAPTRRPRAHLLLIALVPHPRPWLRPSRPQRVCLPPCFRRACCYRPAAALLRASAFSSEAEHEARTGRQEQSKQRARSRFLSRQAAAQPRSQPRSRAPDAPPLASPLASPLARHSPCHPPLLLPPFPPPLTWWILKPKMRGT